MEEKVKVALDRLRPTLSGVDVALADVRDGIVKVKLMMSTCHATMSEEMALEIVEEQLKEAVPEIREVIAA
ncbi:MAG: NifU family protein [Chloroflexota bacterium]|nr:NifU family protein [Chloroflexota bacterium]